MGAIGWGRAVALQGRRGYRSVLFKCRGQIKVGGSGGQFRG